MSVSPGDPRQGCQDYTLEVTGRGTVNFEGRSGVWMLGKYSHSIPVTAIGELVSAFDEAKFFTLRDEYVNGLSPHGSGYALKLAIGARTKSVFTYRSGGGPDVAPEILKILVQRLEDASDVQRYMTEGAKPRAGSLPNPRE